MGNLNDLVQLQTDWTFKGYPIRVELILGHYNFPELDDETLTDYRRAFAQLYGEVIDARPQPTKVRITSKLEEDIQKVLIEHNGNQIRADILNTLNRNIQRTLRGEPTYTTPGRHGNIMAAKILRKYGGTLKLSNINQDEYYIQTLIEIPIPKTSTLPSF